MGIPAYTKIILVPGDDRVTRQYGISRVMIVTLMVLAAMIAGVVVLLIPATILGLGIGPAVALHEGSTLVVVFNALRLLTY